MKAVFYVRQATMDANLIRMAWSVIDETPTSHQRNLALGEKIGAVIHELESRITLSPQERQQIRQYLVERQHLITELYP